MFIQESIHTFIISLRTDQARRSPLEKQLQEIQLAFSVFDAVDGKSLSADAVDAVYDRIKSVNRFNRELSRGELGCALSHLGIYREMVEKNMSHALILEDDAKILDATLSETLSDLARRYPTHVPVAVLLSRAERFDRNKATPLNSTQCVYNAYRAVGAHGYFLTQAAAQILLQRLYPIHVVADKWEYFEKFVSVKVLVPYVVGLSDASLSSSIDKMGMRIKKIANGRTVFYYLRKYARQIAFAMISRPFIQVERQKKSNLDLQ